MNVALIVQSIKLVQDLWSWAKENNLVNKKADREVAQASFEILSDTEGGKILLGKIAALSEEEADKLWDEMLAHGKAADPPPIAAVVDEEEELPKAALPEEKKVVPKKDETK